MQALCFNKRRKDYFNTDGDFAHATDPWKQTSCCEKMEIWVSFIKDFIPFVLKSCFQQSQLNSMIKTKMIHYISQLFGKRGEI